MLHTHNATPIARCCPDTCLIAAIFTVMLPLLQFFHDQLLYQRYLIEAGEIWRIWSGNLVHTNYWHLGLNLLGFWILAIIQPGPTGRLAIMTQTALIATGVGAGLWFLNPEVIWYAGFSGVLYGLFLLTGIRLLTRQEWLPAALILLGICGKTVWDWQQGGASLSSGLIEAPVIYAAHIYGMASALLLALPTLYHLLRSR